MYLSFLRMVKATSFRDQLNGCFSLNRNCIVYIAFWLGAVVVAIGVVLAKAWFSLATQAQAQA